MALDIKIFTVKEKICAWEIHDKQTGKMYNDGARPFRSAASLDKIVPSAYFVLPYTKKQLKTFPYIGKSAPFFEELFESTDEIHPVEKYDNAFKQTFGADSRVFALYQQKAKEPAKALTKPDLYIDFEAMNMRICGWYAELVDGDELVVFEGKARPFSDSRYVNRLWKNTYCDLLPYDVQEICDARHIRSYERYFMKMFMQANKIYTYGDTDSLFVKSTFGNEMYNFFKVKNIDCSLRIGNRVLSLEKTCKLFNINMEGVTHNPRFDVQRMRAYYDIASQL
jgi:hypothetical protein